MEYAGNVGGAARGSDVWQQIKSHLAAKIPPQAFHNWVIPTRLEGQENGLIRVLVPDQVTKDFLEQEYSEVVYSAIQELKLPVRSVVYTPYANGGAAPSLAPSLPSGPGSAADIPKASPEPSSKSSAEPGFVSKSSAEPISTYKSSAEPIFASAVGQLNPKFRFENFVVGSCNQFAHAAARAVANQPARSYNPLFIYGGVGMGKTHLMHAIGRELLDQFPTMRIAYTSGERFMNDMVACLRSNRMSFFHRHYRSADVLLLDDVHILGGKERTQEEFFHTFNVLYEHQKQIVISSDSTPKEIPGLVERLRSRFEWGLMVDVQPPDLETKMAILDKKAELEGVILPEEVRIYIATKTKSNVRELEGALVKVTAFASMTRTDISLSMAQQVLKYLIPGNERRITMEAVIRAVADEFKLQPAQLKQKSNAHTISYPRQVAMYLIKELTPASLPEIGRTFGGKHHTTVLHATRKIEKLRQTKADLNILIQRVTDSIH